MGVLGLRARGGARIRDGTPLHARILDARILDACILDACILRARILRARISRAHTLGDRIADARALQVRMLQDSRVFQDLIEIGAQRFLLVRIEIESREAAEMIECAGVQHAAQTQSSWTNRARMRFRPTPGKLMVRRACGPLPSSSSTLPTPKTA